MGNRAEILLVDYENSIPKTFSELSTIGYRVTVAKNNAEASLLANDVDLIILMVADKKKECLKLMDHIKSNSDSSMNFIVILGGGDDRSFTERINAIAFQCFKKYRFGITELTKTIENAIEMRRMRVKEQRFLQDLNRIEEELRMVENRLYTLSSLKMAMRKRTPRMN